MKIQKGQNICIVGAGLVGSLLAVLLAKRGFCVDLFERNPDGRQTDIPVGRSINLALAERGRHALKLAGLLEKVDQFTLPMAGRMLHYADGKQVFQAYGKDPAEVNYSVHRAQLNHCMLDAAEATNCVNIHFNNALFDIDFINKNAIFKNTKSDETIQHKYTAIIGADGAFSSMRKAMSATIDVGETIAELSHGYRELSIAADRDGDYALAPNALHIWPRGGYMLIGLPNIDRSFTATLFMAHRHSDTEPGFDQLSNWTQQRQFMHHNFKSAIPVLNRLQRDFSENPQSRLATVRCQHWQHAGALLIGDAAHGIVPFHGQGMNAGFEDCSLLIQLLDTHSADHWQNLFDCFEKMRKPDTDAIATMALENYQIMREAVNDPLFLLRKKLERELERRFPPHFIARYSQVMFHRTPYSEVLHKGLAQTEVLDKLLANCTSIEDIDWSLAARLLEN